MCFIPGSGWKHLDLEQYRISGLTMDASRMCRDQSPLDHGSMTGSYVMSSLQSCASILSPCELPYMIRHLCNYICCFYVVFAGIRWIMRLCSDCDELYIWFSFYILFLSNSVMFSIASYYFGQVVDSN